MLGNGTTNISKDDFNEEVDFLGAPKKSTSSLKSSFEMFVVPLPSIDPNKEVTPALSPSMIGSLSIVRL